MGIATKYFYDEMGNLVETDTYDPNGNLLTVSRTLYDTEGRAIVSVGPYAPNVYDKPIAEWPVGTETVYDALGRAAQTRRWAGVKVDLMPFKVIKPSGQTVPCLISDSDMAGKMVPVGVTPKHAWDGTGDQPGLNSIGWTSDSNLPVVKFTLAPSGEIGPLSYGRMVYDVGGRVQHSIGLDENGDEQITTYQYDKAGKQTVVIDPCGHSVSRTQVITLHDGIRASQINLDSITYNDTHRTDTHYDGTRRDNVTDACDNTTYFAYDVLGRVIKTTYPPAKTGDPNTYIYVGYDGFGRKQWESKQTAKTLEQLTAEDTKEYGYDNAGRLTDVNLPQNEMESPLHNGSTITARPRYEYVYDNFGNLVESRDNIYVLQNGSIVDTYARATKFTYDHLNNQISRELPGGATEYKEYDELGRIYFAEDFKGQVTGFEYDSQGRLEYKKYYADETRYDANDPCETVRYTYDNLGRRKEIIEARGTTTYEYDAEGNIEEVNSPEGVINYDYDPVTSRKSATSTANTETQFDYDAMGRLKAAELVKRNGGSVSELTTYEYTPTGSRSKMLLPNGVTTNYSYDNLNRLLDVTHTKTGQLSKYEYTLAADGMRQQLTEDISTGGGRTVDYTYDNLNRVLTESAAADSNSYDIEYTYDVAGNRTKRAISANGQCMQTDYVYNDRDELTKETHIDPGVCAYLNDKPVYAYTSNGQITNYRLYGSSKDISPFRAYLLGIPNKWSDYATTTVLGLLPITFLLPVFARVIRRGGRRAMPLLRQGLIVLLAYLMLLNPSWVQQDTQAAIDYSNLGTANWGTTNRDIHYYYDANGSCVKKIEAVKDTANPDTTFVNKTLYTYDLRNQLVKVEYTANGTNWDTTTYKYNDDGIRVEKNDNGTITQYLVDSHNHTGYAQVLEERTGGALTKTCIIGDDCIGEIDNSNALKYYLYDGQGSVRHHSNSSGGLVSYSSCDTFAYDAYGQRVDPLKDTVNNGLFYTGEQWDNSAQMYYLRARYYDPLNGRFNQMDSFAGNNQDPQSLHKYAYCHANPINGIDPSGNFDLVSTMTVIGQIATVIMVAVYSYRAGGVIYKLTSSEEQLVDEGYLEAEDLVHDVAIDAVVTIATFGFAKFIQGIGSVLRATKKVAALTRFERNIECGAKAEKFLLGTNAGKKAFTTTLGTVIPDRVTLSAIDEIKNVKYLSNSPQMKKMVQLAKGGKDAFNEPARKLILHVREDTKISKPLQDALNALKKDGLFELKTDIPPGLAP